MGEDDIVYVRGHTGTGKGVYHSEVDCDRLNVIQNQIPKRLKLVEDFRDECSVCCSGGPSNTEQDHSYHKALQAEETEPFPPEKA